jgi:hypothetical protein
MGTRKRSASSVRGKFAVLLSAVLGLALLAPMTSVHAADGGSTAKAGAGPTKVGFGVVPATAHGLDSRSLFSYGLTPGSVAYDHVAIVNYSPKRLDLAVYATDAINSPEGGYALRRADEKPVDLGAWLSVGSTSRAVIVSVPGRRKDGSPGRVIMPVSITVPLTATPGDHAAGIIASLETLGKNPKGQNIRLEQRVAGRVYVRVAGQLVPSLSVTPVKAHYVASAAPWKSGSVVVDYTVSNSGNLRMGFKPSVTVKGPWGIGAHTVTDEAVAEILPGNSRTFHTVVHGVWPMLRLNVTASARPVAAIAAQEPGLGVISRTIRIMAVTWVQLVLFLLLLGFLGYRIFRRLQRNRLTPGRRGLTAVAVPKETKTPVSSAARSTSASERVVRRSFTFKSKTGRIGPTL